MHVSAAVACLAPLASLALVSAAPAARACGAFFASETSQNLALGAQRALLQVGLDDITLHLQMSAASDGKAFAWVIPVPAGGEAPTLTLGDGAVFDALDALTTPSVTIERGGGGGGGGFCGSADKAGGGLGDTRDGVQHFGGDELGPYTYDIIAGSSAEAVQGWLGENGYVVPEAFGAAIAPYVDGSLFVAVRLGAGAASDGAVSEPLVVTWPRSFDAGLGYAFGMSRLSAQDVMPLVLWVLADKRQRVANYGSIELSHVAEVMRDDDVDYASAVARLTDDAGGRLVVTEFARDLRGVSAPAALTALVDDEAFYLTRLYAATPRDAIEDLVITFAADAPDVDSTITVSQHEGSPLVMAASCLVLFGLRAHARSRFKLGATSRRA